MADTIVEAMCYVAADPDQPGAAWAATVDDPKYAKNNANEVAEWIEEGAHVLRVPVSIAREMLCKWDRTKKRTSVRRTKPT